MVLSILRSRKFAKRVMIGLLILIIPAFVLWGVGSVTKKGEIVGSIGRNKIRITDFVKSMVGIKIQMLFTYYQNVPALNNILRNRPMVNYMAWERLIFLDAASRDKKFDIVDSDVRTFILGHPLFQRNGVFDQQLYQYILKNNLSMEPRQFEEIIRENLRIRLLRQDIVKDVAVSEEEIKELFSRNNDKVELSILLINKDIFADNIIIAPEDTRDFYDKNEGMFSAPAKVEAEYVDLPYKDLAEKDSISEKIREIYPEFTSSPEDFKKIAAKHGLRYGTTGPFSSADVMPGIAFSSELHKTVLSLETGALSPPLFSSEEKGSAYIFRKTMEIPSRPLSYEEAEEKIQALILENNITTMAILKATDIFERIDTEETTLERSAAELKQKIIIPGPITSSEYIDTIGPAGEIVITALSAEEGSLLDPMPSQNGALLVRVDKIIPADVSDFEDEKDTLRSQLVSGKQMAALNNWITENSTHATLNRQLEEL